MNIPRSSIEPFGYTDIPQVNILTDVGEFGEVAHIEAFNQFKTAINFWYYNHRNPNSSPVPETNRLIKRFHRLER